MTLEELYNELGTLQWVGSEENWDAAINAVRKKIRDELSKEEAEEEQEEKEIGNAFGLSDEMIYELYEKLQESISKDIISPKLTYTKCPICGRDEKYISGTFAGMTGYSRMHCKYDCTRSGVNNSGRPM